jgi:hypothetical protein
MQPISEELPRAAGANPVLIGLVLLILLGLLALYLFLIGRAVIQMLRHSVSPVLLTFAFLALIPLPPVLVLGIMVLIVWHYHKKDLLKAPSERP